jgi:hypothetical protein
MRSLPRFQLQNRPHFDCAEAPAGNLRREVDGLVEISGVDQDEPPSCSFVSAKGPSVTDVLPPRVRRVVAARTG